MYLIGMLRGISGEFSWASVCILTRCTQSKIVIMRQNMSDITPKQNKKVLQFFWYLLLPPKLSQL